MKIAGKSLVLGLLLLIVVVCGCTDNARPGTTGIINVDEEESHRYCVEYAKFITSSANHVSESDLRVVVDTYDPDLNIGYAELEFSKGNATMLASVVVGVEITSHSFVNYNVAYYSVREK